MLEEGRMSIETTMIERVERKEGRRNEAVAWRPSLAVYKE